MDSPNHFENYLYSSIKEDEFENFGNPNLNSIIKIPNGPEETCQSKNEEHITDSAGKNIKINLDEDLKSKRRSKNEQEGRTYRCEFCHKAYLSYPALYTHKKTKHLPNGNGKGRGRPKCAIKRSRSKFRYIEFNPERFDYFSHPERTGEVKDFKRCVEMVYSQLYNNNVKIEADSLPKLKHYGKILCHPLYNILLKMDPKNMKDMNEESRCDEVFADYIMKISFLCHDSLFIKILRFLTIYRDFLNLHYINSSNGEYCVEENSENVPDPLNTFLQEHMKELFGYFDLKMEECIEYSQNFCRWLYDNYFTTSRVTLNHNN
jgi:hypothetical protein